ncbi:hypothetical protein AAHA92_24157 [Salvia divinorum]|uniref:Uncharacterized protein n=1 Tax=Salvia divinorum TaxID=28513 RepID=A0ABD1G6G9_SALDI
MPESNDSPFELERVNTDDYEISEMKTTTRRGRGPQRAEEVYPRRDDSIGERARDSVERAYKNIPKALVTDREEHAKVDALMTQQETH